MTPMLDAITTALEAIITALAIWGARRIVMALDDRNSLDAMGKAQQTVLGAAKTAAGIIQTKLDQGVLKISEIGVENPAIIAEAKAALARVPDAVALTDKSRASMAETVVGLVDTSAKAIATELMPGLAPLVPLAADALPVPAFLRSAASVPPLP